MTLLIDCQIAPLHSRQNISVKEPSCKPRSVAQDSLYPLAVFINIASVDTHADVVPTGWRDRIACFAVSLRDGKAHVIQSETL
ncbi:hypothetical protein [Burkholderia contaminans]|uniref:hypothetical protein n=1 Tax=Burkholderia contaminans TaxID=488447 RepID=UPI00115F94A7|nr:hypothetical protein [Burkholderia contaminans]